MNLIERLVAKGWRRSDAVGVVVTNGDLWVQKSARGWVAGEIMPDGNPDEPFRNAQGGLTEHALLRSRVGAVTVAAILGEPEPSVDDVIRERLIAVGWRHCDSLRIGLRRDDWHIHDLRELRLLTAQKGAPIVGKSGDLLGLMRAPFGSVTVAAFCGIDVSDLEVTHD